MLQHKLSIKYTFQHEERIWIAMLDLIKRTTHNRRISLGIKAVPIFLKGKTIMYTVSFQLDIRTIVIIVVLTYLRKVHGKQNIQDIIFNFISIWLQSFLIQSRSYPSLINIKPLTSFLLLWKMNLETQHQSVWRKASTGMRSTSVCYCMQRDVFVPVIMILADRVILRRVLLNLSTNPFQEEWYGIVLVFARLINSASCFIKSPSKFRPSSIWSFRGTQK